MQPVISCFFPSFSSSLTKGFELCGRGSIWLESSTEQLSAANVMDLGLSRWENSLIGNGPFTGNGDTAQSTWCHKGKTLLNVRTCSFLFYFLAHPQQKPSSLIDLFPIQLATLFPLPRRALKRILKICVLTIKHSVCRISFARFIWKAMDSNFVFTAVHNGLK